MVTPKSTKLLFILSHRVLVNFVVLEPG